MIHARTFEPGDTRLSDYKDYGYLCAYQNLEIL